MKRLITILLAVMVFVVLAGCGAAPQSEMNEETATSAESESPAAAKTTATPAVTSEAPLTPSPTPEPITYQWNGIELVLEGIAGDAEVSADIGTPSGKFVVVTLSFEDELIVDDLVAVYKELFSLTCGGETYSPVAYVAQNSAIDHEKYQMVSTGPLLLYFDLPADADISDAVFAITEAS